MYFWFFPTTVLHTVVVSSAFVSPLTTTQSQNSELSLAWHRVRVRVRVRVRDAQSHYKGPVAAHVAWNDMYMRHGRPRRHHCHSHPRWTQGELPSPGHMDGQHALAACGDHGITHAMRCEGYLTMVDCIPFMYLMHSEKERPLRSLDGLSLCRKTQFRTDGMV